MPPADNKSIIIWVVVLALAALGGGGVYLWQAHLFPSYLVEQASQPSLVPTNGGSQVKSAAPLRGVSFTPPYLVNWEDGNIKFSLIGAELGMVPVPPPPNSIQKDTGEYYAKGELVWALALKIKVKNSGSEAECPNLKLRRLANNEGDLIIPNMRQFLFPDYGGCLLASSSSHDVDILFLVPQGERTFTITPGVSDIFFTVTALGDNSLEIKRIPVPPGVTPVPPPSPRPPPPTTRSPLPLPVPPTMTWLAPLAPITIARGGNIMMSWQAFTTPRVQNIQATLLSASGKSLNDSYQYFDFASGTGNYRVIVPPGKYILHLSAYGTQGTKEIPVEVTGAVPTLSVADSEFSFDQGPSAEKAQIIADGICGADATVYLVDEFGFPLAGKQVMASSSRGDADIVLAKATATKEDGSIGFFVASKLVGVSTLTASVEGKQLRQALIMQVLNPQDNKCTQESIISREP